MSAWNCVCRINIYFAKVFVEARNNWTHYRNNAHRPVQVWGDDQVLYQWRLQQSRHWRHPRIKWIPPADLFYPNKKVVNPGVDHHLHGETFPSSNNSWSNPAGRQHSWPPLWPQRPSSGAKNRPDICPEQTKNHHPHATTAWVQGQAIHERNESKPMERSHWARRPSQKGFKFSWNNDFTPW